MISEQAAARVGLPFGTAGLELSDSGNINQEDLAKEIRKNGRSVEPGKVVTVTNIELGDRSISIELNGGGKNKPSFFERIQIGVGGVGTGPNTNPQPRPDDPAKVTGSKVTLKFAQKVPSELTPDQLKELLDPVLDFEKSNFLRTGINALPPEFQEAVKLKEARIGMDRSTVILAMDRPHERHRDPKLNEEYWLYRGRGLRVTEVTFDAAEGIVIRIVEHGPPEQPAGR
jgi:hypothetical protein